MSEFRKYLLQKGIITSDIKQVEEETIPPEEEQPIPEPEKDDEVLF